MTCGEHSFLTGSRRFEFRDGKTGLLKREGRPRGEMTGGDAGKGAYLDTGQEAPTVRECGGRLESSQQPLKP